VALGLERKGQRSDDGEQAGRDTDPFAKSGVVIISCVVGDRDRAQNGMSQSRPSPESSARDHGIDDKSVDSGARLLRQSMPRVSIVALVMAVRRWQAQLDPTPSVYEERGAIEV
jgi:hypothetical protein